MKLDNWAIGELGNWTAGILENWTTGELDNWTAGILEYWLRRNFGGFDIYTHAHLLTLTHPKQPKTALGQSWVPFALCFSVFLCPPSCTVVFLFVPFCCSSLPYRAAYCGVLLWSSPGRNGSESISRRAAHHGCSLGSNL